MCLQLIVNILQIYSSCSIPLPLTFIPLLINTQRTLEFKTIPLLLSTSVLLYIARCVPKNMEVTTLKSSYFFYFYVKTFYKYFLYTLKELSTCLHVLVYLSTCLLVHLSTCLPVYLSSCLLVYLSTCLLVYLSSCQLVFLYFLVLFV